MKNKAMARESGDRLAESTILAVIQDTAWGKQQIARTVAAQDERLGGRAGNARTGSLECELVDELVQPFAPLRRWFHPA